jgi:hypothetical protein
MWNVRNFARHDANILNPRLNAFNGEVDNLKRDEFPLMQWSIAMVQKVLGERIEIVRLLIFLLGVMSMFGMFLLFQLLFKNWLTSFIATFLFQYSPLFFYYTINPLPDNLALCGGIWYIYFIKKYFDTVKNKDLILAGISLLIATLAKLPFLMFSILSIVYFFGQIFKERKLTITLLKFAVVQLLIVSPALLWYAWVMPGWTNNPILYGVLAGDFSMEKFWEILGYYASVTFPTELLSMPVWILILTGILNLFLNKYNLKWLWSLVIITFMYLIMQANAIGTVHDYYMFPFLPWLFVLLAAGVESFSRLSKYMKYPLFAICLWSACFTYEDTYSKYSLDRSILNRDFYVYSEELKAAAPRDARCIIMNDKSKYIYSYRIDKMGYIFRDDHLPIKWVDGMVRDAKVRYMYSDSEKMNNNPELKKYIDHVIMTKG